jgi:ribosomal protein L7/L12
MNDAVLVGALITIAVAMVLARLSAVEARLNRLARLDAKVDALLKHAGITFDAFQDVPPAVREALERGQRIEAIRRYREATGTDLKSAKEAVDEVRRRGARAS